MIVALVVSAVIAAPGCATMRKDKTVCPEYRNLRCLTPAKCTNNKRRGCRVCRCSKPNEIPSDDKALPE